MTLREAWRWADRRFTLNLLGIVIKRNMAEADRLNRRAQKLYDRQRRTLDRIDKLARWQMEIYSND